MVNFHIYYCFTCDDVFFYDFHSHEYTRCSCSSGRPPPYSDKIIMTVAEWSPDDLKKVFEKDPKKKDYEFTVDMIINATDMWLATRQQISKI